MKVTLQGAGRAAGSGLGRAWGLTPDACCVSGILYGTMTMELGGRVTIACKQSSLQAELEFKLKVVLGPGSSEPVGIPRPLCALEVVS